MGAVRGRERRCAGASSRDPVTGAGLLLLLLADVMSASAAIITATSSPSPPSSSSSSPSSHSSDHRSSLRQPAPFIPEDDGVTTLQDDVTTLQDDITDIENDDVTRREEEGDFVITTPTTPTRLVEGDDVTTTTTTTSTTTAAIRTTPEAAIITMATPVEGSDEDDDANDVTANTTTTPRLLRDTITVSSSDMRECLAGEQRLVLDSFALQVAFSFTQEAADGNGSGTTTSSGGSGGRVSWGQCWVMVTAPRGALLHVQYREVALECDNENVLDVYDGPEGSPYRSISVDGCEDWHGFVSTSRWIHFRLRLNKPVQRFSVKVVVKVVSPSDRPELELHYFSPLEGYVQTPGWDRGLKYPALMSSGVTLTPPPGHVTFLSFRQLNLELECNYDTLSLYQGWTSSGAMLWRVCGSAPPAPRVHLASRLHVLFTSDINVQLGGFRLLFSFHPSGSQPQQTPGGLWNCSGPHWPSFRRHFRCNLDAECAGQEDELMCPYSRCGPGLISAGERCYVTVTPNSSVTWNEALMGCVTRGARLASLNTPEEWRDVTAVLAMGRMSRRVYLGLKSPSTNLPAMYKDTWQWVDNSIAYYTRHLAEGVKHPACSSFPAGNLTLAVLGECNKRDTASYLCEFPPETHSASQTDTSSLPPQHSDEEESSPTPITMPSPQNRSFPSISAVACPAGHVTHSFLACDAASACWEETDVIAAAGSDDAGATTAAGGPEVTCAAPVTSLPPSLPCRSGRGRVSYSLVCDHRADCSDNSDEESCVFPPCDPGNTQLQCSNEQCVWLRDRCDGQTQCTDASDEQECAQALSSEVLQRPPPNLVTLDMRGGFTVSRHHLNDSQASGQDGGGEEEGQQHQQQLPACPETHFRCPRRGYCLPVYLRCNGVTDCPGREDEEGCGGGGGGDEGFALCPGMFRCRGAAVCLHASHVCDGLLHCPRHDDELYCDVACPPGCTCLGLAATCPRTTFLAYDFPQLRYLDAGGSGMTPRHVLPAGKSSLSSVSFVSLLVFLSLARCRLTSISSSSSSSSSSSDDVDDLPILALPNLRTLDLSGNRLSDVSLGQLVGLPQLRTLVLAANPLLSVFSRHPGWTAASFPLQAHSTSAPHLQRLDLSRVTLPRLNASMFLHFPELRTVNVSGCGVEELGSLRALTRLAVLDVRGGPVTSFPRDVFAGLAELRAVLADNYKLCCPDTLPATFLLSGCAAPVDEISSCHALLRSDLYRILLALFAALALLGNLGSFVARVFVQGSANNSGFAVFVTHLCVADFLMGVYLALVGVADRLYLGVYLWEDEAWRHSVACRLAGFLSLLSSEVSAFIICLITIDRFLVLRFPFSRLHFRAGSAHWACACVWTGGLVLAAVPLLPATEHWAFYSRTGICVPLPINSQRQGEGGLAGHRYSFAVMIVLNLVLFVLIAAGQVCIYASIRANSLSEAQSSKKTLMDSSIARRLFTIAISDFLCWFPIGLLGLMSWQGLRVPGEVNVALAIIALPINSALNPFLYTLNTALEHQRRRNEARLRKIWMTQITSKISMTDVSAVNMN